jgi:hypothetical protein
VARGGYPIPGILQSVRKGLIAKELEETVAFKCEASVRKGWKTKELEEKGEVQGTACTESRRLIRDAKIAFRRGWASIYTGENSTPVRIG